jgi:hypothetical protein
MAVARDIASQIGRRETRARMSKEPFRKKGAGAPSVPAKARLA